jgi:hypothetical protein
MKTIKLLTYVLFITIISLATSSCEGEAGPAGADGVDGNDGNANVQTYIFTSPSWDSNKMTLTLSALTSDVLTNDVVLGYWKSGLGVWYSTDAFYVLSGLRYFRSYATLGIFNIRAYNSDNSEDATPPGVNKVKIIIIESSNTTTVSGNGRMTNPQQAVYNELENAGIDINNYYEVCNYYGINPE